MEGEAGDPYRRPARRTQWLLSALAHHYGLDRGVENEIVVLATGLDQYLQEVFHHLDCRGAGRLPRADFRALCAVLGLNADGEVNTEDANSAEEAAKNQAAGIVAGGDADVREEARLALRADPPELTFRQFHARLCGYFSTRAGPRLPRGALSEHIETQIRLRRPRRRRRPGSPSLHSGANGERVAHLEEENSSLRELVEDLRAALQSSDARCLALQVGLWKSQSDIPEAAAHKLQRAQGALAEAEARARRLQRGQVEVRLRTEEARQAVRRSLHRVRELEALARRVPRMQRQVQRLEAELRRYRSSFPLVRPRRQPGEGSGEVQESSILRSERPQLLNSSQASVQPGDKNGDPMTRGTRGEDTNPGGTQQPDTSLRSRDTDEEEEQLFRSVEGQAASEEEEEDRWQEKSRPPQAHAQVPLVQPSGCVSRCGERTAEMLKTSFGHCDDADHICTLELETRVTKLGEQLQALGCSGKTLGTPEEAELQQMETEHLRLELQMVETERVRLSLLEEKLVDVLQLLQRLRDLRVHMALWPSWTPCTKPWLAVSSCREIPQHQRPQLGHTRTPSSSPVELPGPVMGHHGHSNHHQTSLDHNQTCFHGQSDHHGTNTGSYWTNLHSQTDRHQSSLLSHPQYCQSSLHGQPGHCWTVFHRLNILHKWFDCCHFLRTMAAKAPSQTGSSSYSSLGPLTFSQNPHTETLQL